MIGPFAKEGLRRCGLANSAQTPQSYRIGK
jgi:hypothetical protein